MIRSTAAFAAIWLLASPALALKVTNLDTVPHKVELAGRGTAETRVIQPDATEHFTGASQGRLSLKSTASPKKAKGAIQSDGMLSGIIGNGRDQDIPVDPNDAYVIWPGGDLRLQSRHKDSNFH